MNPLLRNSRVEDAETRVAVTKSELQSFAVRSGVTREAAEANIARWLRTLRDVERESASALRRRSMAPGHRR